MNLLYQLQFKIYTETRYIQVLEWFDLLPTEIASLYNPELSTDNYINGDRIFPLTNPNDPLGRTFEEYVNINPYPSFRLNISFQATTNEDINLLRFQLPETLNNDVKDVLIKFETQQQIDLIPTTSTLIKSNTLESDYPNII